MSFADALRTLFEIALVLLVIWSIFNENRLIAFEERIFSRFRRRRLHIIKGGSKVCSTCRPAASECSRQTV